MVDNEGWADIVSYPGGGLAQVESKEDDLQRKGKDKERFWKGRFNELLESD